MLLRARTVLPLCAPPIEDGAVLIRGERIEAVGRWKDLQDCAGDIVTDLGDATLLPGLINAHCHLDYTGMAGQLRPAKNFSDWIKGIVALKAAWSYTEFANSWVSGANMLLRSGTTTVVDVEAVPELLPDVTTSTPLRVISCLELLSVRGRQSALQLLETAVKTLQALPAETCGLSPHAPYSTSPELLRAAAAMAHSHRWLLTTHVAESADEFEMYQRARGAMFDWLKPQRDMNDCDGRSPVQHLARCDALGPNVLAVHANYLADGDAELLSRSGASLVHCPRSHAFFGHAELPLDKLAAAGVNICLGTDSMATMPRSRAEPLALSMFSELRTFVGRHPNASPQRVLEMATLNAAKAIGRAGELGAIASGACADLILVPLAAHRGDPHDAVLHCRNDVSASMIRGEWAVAPSS
jgi:aminodeoxyfutalosine deaminase